jgi:hypothetical protein
MSAAINDMETFWADNAAAFDLESIPTIDPERVQPYQPNGIPCDGEFTPADEIKDNAMALDCPEGSAILWDAAFIARTQEEIGEGAPYSMLAHEYGHVVASVADPNFDDIYAVGIQAEQFADCAEGAWLADAHSRRLPQVADRKALDDAALSKYDFSDLPEDSVDSEEAHGGAFDRIYAFIVGVDGGPNGCAGLRNTPIEPAAKRIVAGPGPAITEDLDNDQLQELATATVAEFAATPQQLDGMEVTADYFENSGDDEARADYGIGWFLTSTAINTVARAQDERGQDAAGHNEIIFQACWTAAMLGWMAAGHSTTSTLTVEALDSAISSLIAYSDPDDPGTLFDSLHHLRGAFDQGVGYCVA